MKTFLSGLQRRCVQKRTSSNVLTDQGLTFAELIVTAFVLTTAIVSALLFFTNALVATQYSKDITVATSHAEYVFEEMQGKPSLDGITSTNWINWYSAQALGNLPSETVSVAYANLAANPLQVTLNIMWNRKQRNYRESFQTRISK